MSGYLVIDAVSQALQKLLRDEFNKEPKLANHVGTQDGISLKNPTEVARTGKGQLSLWLYNITENEFLRNEPPNGNKAKRFPPLPLNLHYLVTPLTTNGEADLMVIGKTMQIFYDNPIVGLRSVGDGIHEQLRLNLERLSVDEQSRIWEALSEPYRLSISYEVRVAHIDSDEMLDNIPVIDRFSGYGDTSASELVG